jgi:hypothetical protein
LKNLRIIAAASVVLSLVAGSAKAQEAANIRQKYESCVSQIAPLNQKGSETVADKLFCACLMGAGVFGHETGRGGLDAVLSRVSDTCQSAFQEAQ